MMQVESFQAVQPCMICGLPVELPNSQHWPQCPKLWRFPVFDEFGNRTKQFVVLDVNMFVEEKPKS